MNQPPGINPWLSDYQPDNMPYDEMWQTGQGIRPHWLPLMDHLQQLGPEEMTRRRQELERLLRENGVTYHVYDEPNGLTRSWKLDPVPMVLDPATWQDLSTGLQQRARVLDHLLQDLYGPQRVLKEGILPAELILADRQYLRPCLGMLKPELSQLLLYAADLARGPDGRMWVIGDRTQAPSGWGYTLENRAAMVRALPDFFQDAHVAKLAPFFHRIRAALASFAPHGDPDPRIVLMTPGPMNETYFEHAYLSAYQGLTLVQGQDLMVRDGYVWLKTLEGLEKVDIILRRVDDDYCDPLALRPESQLGVAGLLEVIRRGNVTVANPLGSGLLENPGLLAFLPSICRFFFDEELQLPSIATWWCGQKTERQYVLDHLDQMVIKSVSRKRKAYLGWQLTQAEKEELRAAILTQPFDFVGQEQAIYATAPILAEPKLAPRNTVLRSFLVATEQGYEVMPGGLTRSAPEIGNQPVSNQRGGISKDTWVLSAEEVSTPVRFHPEATGMVLAPRSLDTLPSRTAENLFWVGRHSVRAMQTARLLRTVIVEWGEIQNLASAAEIEVLHLLLSGLTHTTLTYPGFVGDQGRKHRRAPDKELRAVILDPNRAGSLAATVRLWANAAYAVRDRWSSDTWRIFDQIEATWSELGKPRRRDFRHIRSALDQLISGLAAFQGLNNEGMTGSEGRFLYDIGRRLEQGQWLCSLLRATLTGRHEDAVTNGLLEAILFSTESLNIYRYRYRALLQLPTVLQMLLLDIDYPRSLAYGLQQLRKRLDQLPERNPGNLREDQRLALMAFSRLRLSLTDQLLTLDDETFVYQDLDDLLAELGQNLGGISDAITRLYFNHAEAPHQIIPVAQQEW
jgi:uncharacterized circularly permuted ATP-grasp superfamily protein/uncharacterized alpha-E superfamily protein